MERASITSYVIYGSAMGAGMTAKGVGDGEETPLMLKGVNEGVNPLVARAAEEAPWLLDAFPDMVADGSIMVRDGSILLYGVGLLDIISFIVIPLTLSLALGKFWMDTKSFKLTTSRLEKPKEAIKCPECGTSIDGS